MLSGWAKPFGFRKASNEAVPRMQRAMYALIVLLALPANTWAVKDPQPPCRKASNLHALPVLDGASKELVLFGGKGFEHIETGRIRSKDKKKVEFLGDTWTFSLSEGEWKRAELKGGQGPGPRWKMESTTFADGRFLVMFGGCSTTTAQGVMNELWVLELNTADAATWRQVYTHNAPPKRRGHVMATNATHLVVFGGKTWGSEMVAGTYDKCITDLWLLPLAALTGDGNATWVQGSTFPAPCRWGATGTGLHLADGSQVMAFFGGRSLSPTAQWHSTSPDAYRYFDDLYFYHFKNDSWVLQHPGGAGKPCKRDHHGAARIGNDLYVFGGRVSEARTADADRADVWSYSVATNTWTEHPTSWYAPSARFMPGVTSALWYGSTVLVVFGGESLPGSTKKSSLNDLWLYSPHEGGGWIKLTDSHCSADYTGLYSLEDLAEELEGEVQRPHIVWWSLLALLMTGLAMTSLAFYYAPSKTKQHGSQKHMESYHRIAA